MLCWSFPVQTVAALTLSSLELHCTELLSGPCMHGNCLGMCTGSGEGITYSHYSQKDIQVQFCDNIIVKAIGMHTPFFGKHVKRNIALKLLPIHVNGPAMYSSSQFKYTCPMHDFLFTCTWY